MMEVATGRRLANGNFSDQSPQSSTIAAVINFPAYDVHVAIRILRY